ncbi:hypothetical protein ACFVT6_05790 [Streptomyces sp. NPDC058049]|uniref:hypothetical protein n=1 Tax=Streptomyces sp. NPDC058049 TaxID=3346314 RepID=UPI0036E6B8B9
MNTWTSRAGVLRPGWVPAGPRSGPFPDQPPPRTRVNRPIRWSAWVQLLYHQETKNMLVSYSPKKLGFF